MSAKENPLAADLASILAQTLHEWESLRGARIFLTGGTGFIGSWLLDSFGWARSELGLDTEIVVLTRNAAEFRRREPSVAKLDGVLLFEGDVRSFIFPEKSFSHVIHGATAASAKLNVDSPLLMVDTIVEGTRRTFDFAGNSGAKVVLNISSGGVYGRQPEGMLGISEEYMGAPDTFDSWSAYGEGKRISELLGAIYAEKFGFEYKVARVFALVGPRLPLNAHFAIGNFIRDALAGGPIKVGGDGTPFRSYMYASDLIVWLLKILVHGKDKFPYNVGSDSALTIGDVARLVVDVIDDSLEIEIAGKAMPGQRGSRYVPCVDRAKEGLGVSTQVPLKEGVIRTAAWARSVA